MSITKKLFAFVCLVVMMVSALVLTGCSLEKNEIKKILEVEDLSGKYELVEMSAGSESYTKEELDALKTLGYTIELELNEDGTGSLSMYGIKQDLTYDEDSMSIDGVDTPYTRSGSKITFEQDDTKLVFDKAE